MISKKRIIWFSIIFFTLILVSLVYLNRLNKQQIKEKFEEITVAEGITIRHLLEVSGVYLAEQGEERLTAFLDRLYRTESIIYIGLFNKEELVYLLSRFEGFFPVAAKQGEYRILDTPLGKVFEILGRFEGEEGAAYRLYIGFNYEFLTAFEASAGRSFSLVVGLFSLTTLLILGLVFYFDKKFFRKELELVEEKQETERFKELSLLTSEIAHEIKNPLNSIYLSFNTLEKHISSDEDALFYRGAIKEEIKRISAILESYSDLSKEVRPHWSDVHIETFSDGFRFLVKEEMESLKVDLKVMMQGETDVRTDVNILKQVLLNLVKNAAEAGAENIGVSFIVKGGTLTLEVGDDGKGIEESVRESIFKPYISTKTKGMGLGLHVTRRLVEALKGDIRLMSAEPGDTRFRVIMPPGNGKQ